MELMGAHEIFMDNKVSAGPGMTTATEVRRSVTVAQGGKELQNAA